MNWPTSCAGRGHRSIPRGPASPDSRVRRVPGLRREEVALLAGVSTDYYTRLEQGRRITPSPAVVEALGRALDLDEAGRAHLQDLFGLTAPSARGSRRPPAVQRLRPGLHQLIDALDGEPALVLGRRTDILAANRMARALFADFERKPRPERNYARWMFLDEAARDLFTDWEDQARTAVESLRLEVGRDPHDRATTELIAELRERSADFDRWWEQHRVHQRTHGSKRLRHPLVGDLTVAYETLTLPGTPTPPSSSTPARRARRRSGPWTCWPAGPSRDRPPGPAPRSSTAGLPDGPDPAGCAVVALGVPRFGGRHD